jgi:hypothetical protein
MPAGRAAATADTTPSTSSGQTRLCPLDEQFAFHRRDGADDGEDEPACRRAGVDAQVEDLQRDLTVLEVVEQSSEVACVPAESGQFGYDQGIAAAWWARQASHCRRCAPRLPDAASANTRLGTVALSD